MSITNASIFLPNREAVEALLNEGPKCIKIGFDPTSPHVHLGHLVLLQAAKRLALRGHKILIILGVATATVGDPSGQTKERKVLSFEEIQKNSFELRKCFQKFFKDTPNITYTDNIWSQSKFSSKVLQVVTLAQLLHRPEVQRRLEAQLPMSLEEFTYPLKQAYDSVYFEPDLELGGTDQLFNCSMGRELMEKMGENVSAQMVALFPILEGLHGSEKMSKSLNNHISMDDAPKLVWDKVHQIDDAKMQHYFHTLFELAYNPLKPIDEKKRLCFSIVELIHGTKIAQMLWDNKFEYSFFEHVPQTETLDANRLVAQTFGISISAANRLIKQKGVRSYELKNQELKQTSVVDNPFEKLSNISILGVGKHLICTLKHMPK
jgi:tyrosyl-tRNA synthetase